MLDDSIRQKLESDLIGMHNTYNELEATYKSCLGKPSYVLKVNDAYAIGVGSDGISKFVSPYRATIIKGYLKSCDYAQKIVLKGQNDIAFNPLVVLASDFFLEQMQSVEKAINIINGVLQS